MILTSLFLIVFSVGSSTPSNSGDRWAEYLEKANEDAANCEEFYDVMSRHKDENATAEGYFALATMIQAKRFGNPFTKLSYFNKGKKILEEVINANPENAELRFLRFAVQTKVPAILLYYHDIDDDQVVLDDYVSKHDDGLAERIKRFYEMKKIESNI